jgi:hypothetical protein
MYTIKLKRYIALNQQQRADLRIYWYNNLKTTFGYFRSNKINKFFINFSKLINYVFYGLKLASLNLSLNFKKTGFLHLIGSVLKTDFKFFYKYFYYHKVGRRLKNKLLKNLNNENFLIKLQVNDRIMFSLGSKIKLKSFLYSKRWY